jgi:hypothetical protein
MRNKKIIALILQLPVILLLITSFFVSIYAAIKNISGIGFSTPVILGIIIILYFYGRYLEKKPANNF